MGKPHEAGPLDALVLSDNEIGAYRRGLEIGRRQAKSKKVYVEREYPSDIVSALDDVADAAFTTMGVDAYAAVGRLQEWLVRKGPSE